MHVSLNHERNTHNLTAMARPSAVPVLAPVPAPAVGRARCSSRTQARRAVLGLITSILPDPAGPEEGMSLRGLISRLGDWDWRWTWRVVGSVSSGLRWGRLLGFRGDAGRRDLSGEEEEDVDVGLGRWGVVVVWR